MPIYEYKCEQCDHQFEILQKISDKPASTCPECNADSLRKLMSAAAFKLKGTGWYETDFKTKKPGKDDKNGKKDNNESKQTAGGTTDETGKISKDSPKKAKKQAKISPTKSNS